MEKELNSVNGLKVWQINDMETWVTETKEQAIKDATEFCEDMVDEFHEYIEEVDIDKEIWYTHEPVSKKDPDYDELKKEHMCTMREAIKRDLAENPNRRSFAFTCTEW